MITIYISLLAKAKKVIFWYHVRAPEGLLHSSGPSAQTPW